MDTRNKILTLAAVRGLEPARPLVIVAGTFDVLVAENAREVAKVRNRTGARTVMAVILPTEREILNQRARAELAAAMGMIDYALICNDADLDQIASILRPAEMVHLETTHARRLHELIEHARERQVAG